MERHDDLSGARSASDLGGDRDDEPRRAGFTDARDDDVTRGDRAGVRDDDAALAADRIDAADDLAERAEHKHPARPEQPDSGFAEGVDAKPDTPEEELE